MGLLACGALLSTIAFDEERSMAERPSRAKRQRPDARQLSLAGQKTKAAQKGGLSQSLTD